MTRKIGTVAKLNGKEVVWAGDDYSWQSRKSFDQLKQQGQLERGAGVVRRIGNFMQQAEDLRHQVFGTDQNLRNISDNIQQAYDESALGLGEQALADLGGKGAQALGLTPALGALAVGMVTPGPGELKAVDAIGDATRATRAANRVRVNGQARRAAVAQASDPQSIARARAATEASPNVQGPRTRQFDERVRASDLDGDEISSVGAKARIEETGNDTALSSEGVFKPERNALEIGEASPVRGRAGTFDERAARAQARRGNRGNQSAAELKDLRERMAQADRTRQSNPDVGVEIEPSVDSKGNRIIYEGDSLNVTTDPDTGRLRGSDTANPRNSRKDLLQDGSPDFEGEAFNEGFGDGYSRSRRRATRGSSGAGSRSMPQSIRQQLEAEFDALHPTRARRAQRAGSRNRGPTKSQDAGRSERRDEWVNRRLDSIAARHTAENFPSRPSSGAVPKSNIEPGARYTRQIEDLKEGKNRVQPGDVERSSVPNLDAQPTNHREAIRQADGTSRTQRTARGGRVSEPSQALEQQRRLDQARRRLRAQQAEQPLEGIRPASESDPRLGKSERSLDPRTEGELAPRRNGTQIRSTQEQGVARSSSREDPKPTRSYVNEQAADYDRRTRASRRGRRASQAEVDAALREVDIEQTQRSDGLPSADGQRIRDHNARIRRDPSTRRGREVRGVNLPDEVIDPSLREMPNRATPKGTEWETQTFGDRGSSGFNRRGELKGVKEKGKLKDKGRSKTATKKAEKLLKEMRGQRARNRNR